MQTDPRNPKREDLIRRRPNTAHPNAFNTLVLLSLDAKVGKIYFVVEGVGFFGESLLWKDRKYFYEESTCPTNFIPIPMICLDGDDDPHGLFSYEDAIWHTKEYEELIKEGKGDAYLKDAFPQLRAKQ